MRILIADDELVSRKMLSAILKRFGHEPLEAVDGDQAWQELEKADAPRLALLDWNMPGLDGPEICRRLRARSGSRYTYVILVTSRAQPEEVVAGLDSGADDFLPKPVEPEELRARVRAAQRMIELYAENDRSRSFLSAVLEEIDSAVLMSDAGGRVVYANEPFSRLMSTTVEQVLGEQVEPWMQHRRAMLGDRVSELAPLQQREGELPVRDFERWDPDRKVIRVSVRPVALPDGVGRIFLFRDVTREVDQEREQRSLARTDPLTGLQNRRGAHEQMVLELARMNRTGRPLSVALFDVDHFKRINDTYGHAAGDRVLQELGRLLRRTARPTDFAVRWGGEEILVILPDTDDGGARAFGDRVRTAVEALRLDGLPSVTISAGVAMVAADETSLDAAVARADARLYEAKASGRNAVR
jgi:two-component system cell cycle response regulator